MRRPSTTSGFTLIEVLVSVAILGLILTALTGGVSFAGRAWTTQETRIARNGDLDSVLTVVRRLVASGRDFDGDEAGLSFVCRLPDALALRGLFECELRLDSDRLVLAWRPHRKTPELVEFTVTELAAHVTDLHLDYFTSGEGGALGWGDSVKPDDGPPRLVSVALSTLDGASRATLIVAPQIEEPPGRAGK